MKNRVSNGANKIVTWILNIVIIVLSLVLFLMIFLLIAEFNSAFNRKRSTESFGYFVSSEEYYQLGGTYHNNMAHGYEPDDETAEYYGVAQYFEAAFIYNAYMETGNEEMAQVYEEKMQAAKPEMGGWDIAIPSIHKQLGIEE